MSRQPPLALGLLLCAGCALPPAAAPQHDSPNAAVKSETEPAVVVAASAEANGPKHVVAATLSASFDAPSLPDPVTLASLEELALANHPSLGQAAAAIDAAEGRRIQSGLPPNPVVGYSASEIGDQGHAGQQGAYFSQELVTAGKLQLNRAIGEQEVRVATWQADAQRRRVLAVVRIRYYEVLAAQRGLELAAQLSGTAQKALEATRRRLEAGDVSRPDVQQAEVQAAQGEILLSNATNRSRAAWRRLAAAVGMPDLESGSVEGSLDDALPDLSWDSAWQQLLEASPELQAAHAGVQRAQAALQRARVEPVPNVLTQAGVQYDAGSLDTIANVQLGVTLPLLDRNQGNIQAAGAELVRARREVDRLELALRDRLAAAFERYENARRQVATYRERILPAARESLELITEGYRQGEFDLARVLLAQRTFFETNLAYLDALVALRRSAVAIESLLLSDPND